MKLTGMLPRTCFSALVFLFGWTVVPFGRALATSQSQAVTIPRILTSTYPSAQRDILGAIGTRLQIPGKERQTFTAQLDRTSGSQTVSSTVTINMQLPGLLRVDDPNQSQVTVFDGTQILKNNGAATTTDQDAVESLLSDTVEGFFYGQKAGSKAMSEGRSYKIMDNRTVNALTGFCDLFSQTGGISVRPGQSTTRKTFCIDALSHLPKVVSYIRSGTLIETRFSDWRSSSGEMLPWKITRMENGVVVLTWTVSSALISPGAADGIFAQP